LVKRQTDSEITQTRVYKYGLVPIDETGKPTSKLPDEARSELWRARRLWNRLVEIHEQYLSDVEEALCAVHPSYGEVTERLVDINEKIDKAFKDTKREARKIAGTTSGSHPLIREANEKINRLKTERTEIRTERTPIFKDAKETLKTSGKRKELEDGFRQKLNEAAGIKNSGLRRDTADAVFKSFRDSRQAFLNGKRQKPRKKKGGFDDTGYFRFVVRSRRTGLRDTTVEEFFNGGFVGASSFKLTPMDVERRKPRFLLRAKLAGNKGEKGVFQDFHLIYHRPIPENASVGDTKIIRERVGNRFTHFVTFDVHISNLKTVQVNGSLGFDLGFREEHKEGKKTKERIKFLAVASDTTDGMTEIFHLPPKQGRWGFEKKDNQRNEKYGFVEKMNYVDELQTALSDNAAALGKLLKNDLKANPIPEEHPKYWLWRKVAYIKPNETLPFEHAYKLTGWVRGEPGILPETAENEILKWSCENRIKYRTMHNTRKKALLERRDYYRCIAAEYAKRAKEENYLLVIDDANFQEMAKVRDDDNDLTRNARRNRVLVAPYEFKLALKNAASRVGVTCRNLGEGSLSKKAQRSSITCSICNYVKWDLGADEKWNCPSCGTHHDRDINAARNIARWGLDEYQKQQRKN